MKKSILFCLAAIVMLTLTACASKVEAAIKNYQDFLVNDSFQYPMNVAKVRNCKAVVIGDYEFFILMDFPDNAIKVIEEVTMSENHFYTHKLIDTTLTEEYNYFCICS